jgi:hypothetical protein
MIYAPIDPYFKLMGYTGLVAAVRRAGWEIVTRILEEHGGIGALKSGLNLDPKQDPMAQFLNWSMGWGKSDDVLPDAAR